MEFIENGFSDFLAVCYVHESVTFGCCGYVDGILCLLVVM